MLSISKIFTVTVAALSAVAFAAPSGSYAVHAGLSVMEDVNYSV
jgi:hypothetical protein